MDARNELLVKLEEIVNRDVDVNDILKEVQALKIAFGKTLETETNKNLENFIGSGGEPKDFIAPKLEGEEKFDGLIALVKDKKQKKENDIKNGQEQNLKTKQDLIEELRDIINNERTRL